VTYYSFSADPFLKNFPATIGCSGLPLDIRCGYKKLIEAFPVTKIFFVRYDIWPSLLFSCRQKNIEINLISATKTKTKKGIQAFISEKWNNLIYQFFSNIFAVSAEDVSYFKILLPDTPVYLAGDAKWARANERAQNLLKTENDSVFLDFIKFCLHIKNACHKKVLVIGSPHKEEYELILKIAELKEAFFIIYVPHSVEEKKIQSLFLNLNHVGYNSILYSNFGLDPAQDNSNLAIIDKVGFLAEIYQVADVAVIGGGFDGQIHNVLEAAAHGVPTLFGSSYARAREASELVHSAAALPFETVNNMFHFLSAWVSVKKNGQAEAALLTPEAILAEARRNAVHLFQRLPDTSEVIFNALHSKA
jgi:3-deoxy-D-manno-octulosonic-acid transferase